MFGKRWEYGRARVVATQPTPGWTYGTHAINKYATKRDFVVDVAPDGGGGRFRASFTTTFGSEDTESMPVAGDDIPVRFRPGGEDVQLDPKKFLAETKAAEDAKQEQFEAAASGSPAEPAARMTISTDPADIERVRERLEGLAAANPGSVIKFGAAGANLGGADRIGRLQQLADLHSSGALTDAEFAAEKARILNQE